MKKTKVTKTKPAVPAKPAAVVHAATIQSVKAHIEALRKAAAGGTILKVADLEALAAIAATL